MPADQSHDEGFFGERVASVYDERSPDMFDPAADRPPAGRARRAGGRHRQLRSVATQRFSSQHYVFADGRVEASPFEFRYAWPAELDLMARLAGLRLRDRWAGWQREPFTSLSRAHVSVYEKP